MQSKVVLHFSDGKILKGTTNDFFPNKFGFHLTEAGNGKAQPISLADLKAVFFVKHLDGNKHYREAQTAERTGMGKKIKILFKDGETMTGYTSGFSNGRAGFFVFPADPNSNNDRVFVIRTATQTVSFD